MKTALASVIANDEIARDVRVLRLEDADQARNVRPGQFVHLRAAPAPVQTTDPLLRRPLSVLRTGASRLNDLPAAQYEILYDVVGRGTELLTHLRPGDLVDVLGPLGQPFKIDRAARNVLLVGGGVGIVPLVALAEEALTRGLTVTLLAGFRTADKVFPAALVPEAVEYVVATNDGSFGHPGLVTEFVPAYATWADQICACGPVPMLRALASIDGVRPRGRRPKPVQIAMEEHMGCAVGVCLGCVVPTRRGLQRVCRDGPVFDLKEMGWG